MATLADKSLISNEEELPKVDLPNTTQVEGGANAEPSKPLRIDITKPSVETVEPSVQPEETSLPLVNGDKIQKALNSGYTNAEVQQYLQSKGLSEDDATLAITSTVSDRIKQAKAAGYSDQDILEHLTKSGYDSNLITSAMGASSVNMDFTKLDYKPEDAQQSEEDKAIDIADLYRNVHYEYATLGKQVVGLLSDDVARSARVDINRLNNAIATKLKQEGINAFIDQESGEIMMTDKSGNTLEVSSDILKSLFHSKGEFVGAVSGGAAGIRAGAAAGAAVGAAFPPIAPIAVPVGTVVGGLSGSAIGAMAGRATDLYINSKKLSEDLSTSLYLTQIKQAGIADITFGVVGSALFKAGTKGYRGILKGYKYITHGNPKGAYKALKENLNLTDDQVKDLLSKYKRLNEKAVPGGSFEEQAINVVANTAKGAETAVKSAALISERVATIAKQSIDARAKSLHKAVSGVADENTGYLIKQDLKAYEDDVKSFYETIKKQGADTVDGTDFRFDIDKLSITPVMKHIEAKLSDPRMRERFVGYASRISYASQDRTFSGLLELRAAVNDFKYSKILSSKDTEALNIVLNKIDSTIDKAAKEYIPNGKQWIKNFQLAKTEYAKMKVFQENTIAKLISRSGITEEGIQRALSKYGNANELNVEVFNAISSKLSPATKVKIEGSAIKSLVDKFTYGSSTDLQAIDFPQLAAELNKLNIHTPEAKKLVDVVNEIGKVYRNDPELASIMGKSLTEKSSSLATNLLQKLKVGAVMHAWNSIYKYAPLASARNIALIHQVEKMLKNPLHAKTAEDLLKAMPKNQQAEMQSLMQQLRIQQAKQGPINTPEVVKMYKQSASGKLVVTDGSLGKGIYLVDKIKNPTSEMNIIKHEVDSSKIFDATGNTDIKKFRTDYNLRQNLVDQGYHGIRVDDKVMLFPETQPGYKTPNIFKDESGKATAEQKIKKDKAKGIVKQDFKNERIINSVAASQAEQQGKNIVYRAAPYSEKAAEITPRDRANYVYVGNKETGELYNEVLKDSVLTAYELPKGIKVLDLDDTNKAEQVLDFLIANYKDFTVKEDLTRIISLDSTILDDLVEGNIFKRNPKVGETFRKYLIKNGYKGYEKSGEKAIFPGVLKDLESKIFDATGNTDIKKFRTDYNLRPGYKMSTVKEQINNDYYKSTFYRVAPEKETAATVKPRDHKYIYTTLNKDDLGPEAMGKDYANPHIAEFKIPSSAKILELSDEEVQKQVFKDLFNNKYPKGYENDLEGLMFDLHEGMLMKQKKSHITEEDFFNYLKNNGYSGHSVGNEFAWLPGVLKDK